MNKLISDFIRKVFEKEEAGVTSWFHTTSLSYIKYSPMKSHQTLDNLLGMADLFEDANQFGFKRLQSVPHRIAEILFPQVFPKVLYRIDLGRIGGLEEQADIVECPQRLTPMPGGPVQHQHHAVALETSGELFEKEVHGLAVGIRQNQGKGLTILRANRTKHMGVFPNELGFDLGPQTDRYPTLVGRAASPETTFILKQQL